MISLIYPISNRVNLFTNTINSIVDTMPDKELFEIIVLDTNSTDNIKEMILKWKVKLDIKYIKYKYPGNRERTNPAYAFNLGATKAKYNSIILSSPEILHKTSVIKQLLELVGQNILCRVVELDKNGNEQAVLMGTEVPTRHDDPGMYFIGMYNKKEYLSIGGLDEQFMQGEGWEDRDFGRRFKSLYKFSTTDLIIGHHQYHPRVDPNIHSYKTNISILQSNSKNNIITANNNILLGDPKYIIEEI